MIARLYTGEFKIFRYCFDLFCFTGNFADSVTNSAYAAEAMTVDGAATCPSCSKAFSWRRNDALGLKFQVKGLVGVEFASMGLTALSTSLISRALSHQLPSTRVAASGRRRRLSHCGRFQLD